MRGADEEETVSASGVEDGGRWIEVEAVEQRIAGEEFADAAAQEHERAEEEEVASSPSEGDTGVVVAGWRAVAHGKPGDEASGAGEEHAADGAWRIEAIIGAR